MFVRLSVLLLPFLRLSLCDTFTSIREMENLFDLEQGLIKSLDNYIKHAVFEIELIELHYKELSKIESEIQDVDKYSENPINAYSVIKRMHYDWPVTFKLMSSSPFFYEEPKYPDKSVLTEAISHIIEWQTKEKLETRKLARGLYEGIMPHANLTASDCLEIAKYCYNKDKHLAAQWLQEALTKVEESEGGSAQLLAQILEYTFLAKCLTDDLEGSVSAFQSLITDGAVWHTPSAKLKNDYELDKVKKCEAAAKKSLKKKEKSSVFKRYDWSTELCHSARRSTKADAGACSIINQWESARFIKYESLQEDDILIIYDFIPNNLMIDLKQSAMEEFKTLKTKGLNGPVHLSNRELAAAVNKQITSNLGILLESLAGDEQIYIHGPGGQHTSLKSYIKQVSGGRFGTLYYFISDVAQGGNIVFPDLKVSIEPRKGTLVFWGDVGKEMDVRECPVLVGSKWAMTQTIVN